MRPLFDILQGKMREKGPATRRRAVLRRVQTRRRRLPSVVLCFSILPARQSLGDGGFVFRAPFICVHLCESVAV